MVSVASGGTADRIAARILFKVLRAGSGTPATYSSTFFGALLPFAAELGFPDFTFFMRAMLRELPLQVHARTTVQPSDMKLVSQDCVPGTRDGRTLRGSVPEFLSGCLTDSAHHVSASGPVRSS